MKKVEPQTFKAVNIWLRWIFGENWAEKIFFA